MAESKKPAARKKTTARRGPTKAAALKALGLTQDDLDYLKGSNSSASAEPMECTCGPNEGCSSCPPKSVGGDGTSAAPSDPQEHLATRPAPQPKPDGIPATTEEPVWYIRNLRHIEVSFRLSRQQDSSKKRTDLKPRGQRGDIVKLESGDLKDAELQTQVAYELVEVIPEGEALAAISKQSTNMQHHIPTHIAALTNAKGEQLYPDQIRMASDEEAYGVKVADLDPRLMQGQLSDQDIRRSGGFSDQVMQPVQNPSPGRIVENGFVTETQQSLGNAANDNERAAQVDALARSKQFEGPGAGLGNVTVKVEPTRRT